MFFFFVCILKVPQTVAAVWNERRKCKKKHTHTCDIVNENGTLDGGECRKRPVKFC